jgi:hypothetical protein
VLLKCIRFSESYDDYATPSLDHARTIAQEKVPDLRYGIFALRSVAGDYEIIRHVNHANLPGPKGSTLRVLWSLVAPKYDVEYVEDYDLTTIIVNVMIGIVKLGPNDMRSRFIKLHLGSMVIEVLSLVLH